jgi:hypothetical protein
MNRPRRLVLFVTFLLVLGCASAALAQELPMEQGMTGPLPCGWNMLGIPIDGPTAIGDCQVRDPSGTILSRAEAVRAGWLQLPAFTYDGNGYRSCGTNPWDDESAFRPWTGYWIFVYRCGIQIIYPIPVRLPRGSGMALKTDRPVYDLCPVCDSIPPSVRMSLVVFNTTCVPVTYNFLSGQEFDFEISDSEGRVIWRWSDGKGFPLVVHSVTLNACSMNPVDRVCIVGYAEFRPLDPKTGALLPAGLYTLRGWLTADKTMESRITFEIRTGIGPGA